MFYGKYKNGAPFWGGCFQTRGVLFLSFCSPTPHPNAHSALYSIALGLRGGGTSQSWSYKNICSAVHEEKGLEHAQLVVKGKGALDICVRSLKLQFRQFPSPWQINLNLLLMVPGDMACLSISQLVLPAFWIPLRRGPHPSTYPRISLLPSVTFCCAVLIPFMLRLKVLLEPPSIFRLNNRSFIVENILAPVCCLEDAFALQSLLATLAESFGSVRWWLVSCILKSRTVVANSLFLRPWWFLCIIQVSSSCCLKVSIVLAGEASVYYE